MSVLPDRVNQLQDLALASLDLVAHKYINMGSVFSRTVSTAHTGRPGQLCLLLLRVTGSLFMASFSPATFTQ